MLMPIAWLFVSDVDDTLLGDDEALSQLAAQLDRVRDHMIIALNSSRPCASLRQSLAAQPQLPRPDYLIGALGTQIEAARSNQPLIEYEQRLQADWDRDRIAARMERFGFEPHAAEYQTTFKISYNVPGEENYRRVLSELETLHLPLKVIYSSNVNLDIIPRAADKGQAADFLRQHLSLSTDRVVVAGDSANDRDMFTSHFKGIVVANADAVLRALDGPTIYHARASHATGVREGLQYWGVIPDERPGS
jgi:sucrose-6F-phosphate phosphohydrolase